MGLINKNLISIFFLLITGIFSYLAYQPQKIVIGGPYFPQLEYFLEELDSISKDLDIAIEYISFSDIETFISSNESTNLKIDLAIIPNPQGVVSLGEKGYIKTVDNILSNEHMDTRYSKHLQKLTTSKINNKNYGVFLRIIPNSIIWYDTQKYKEYGTPSISSYDELIEFTKINSSEDNEVWCMDSESGGLTGWIQTNWLEDLILHQSGLETYDEWQNQNIRFSDNDIKKALINIGDLIFLDYAVYGGYESILNKEFRNNFFNLTDQNIPCIFSWSGHYATLYFPEDKKYGRDYDFFKFPSAQNKDAMVGIGDTIVILDNSKASIEVFKSLTNKSFGKIWITKEDSTYISANMISNIDGIKNKMLIKKTELVRNALKSDSFRFDASELMERRVGGDYLLEALRNYILYGNDFNDIEVLDEILNKLDENY